VDSVVQVSVVASEVASRVEEWAWAEEALADTLDMLRTPLLLELRLAVVTSPTIFTLTSTAELPVRTLGVWLSIKASPTNRSSYET